MRFGIPITIVLWTLGILTAVLIGPYDNGWLFILAVVGGTGLWTLVAAVLFTVGWAAHTLFNSIRQYRHPKPRGRMVEPSRGRLP